jgi:hypothetical protein
MDLHNRFGEKSQNRKITVVEAKLEQLLQPVEPRAEFSANLKRSLLHQPETSLREPGQGVLQYALWGTAGVLSGAVILVVGIKAVAGLIGSIQQVKKQVEHNPSASLGSAS